MDAFDAELPDVIFFRVKKRSSQWLKITQNVAFEFLNYGIFHHFLVKAYLSGITVSHQASGLIDSPK